MKFVCDVLQIIPPVFSVFPVEEADRVFQQLNQSKINGRAVFRVSSSADSGLDIFSGDDAVELSASTPTSPCSTTNPDTTEPAFFLPESST